MRAKIAKEYTENMSSLFEHEYPDGFKASDIKYADRDNSELAEINYTSGTTGNSKGVMLSANSLAGNITFGFETYLTGRNIRILSFCRWLMLMVAPSICWCRSLQGPCDFS